MAAFFLWEFRVRVATTQTGKSLAGNLQSVIPTTGSRMQGRQRSPFFVVCPPPLTLESEADSIFICFLEIGQPCPYGINPVTKTTIFWDTKNKESLKNYNVVTSVEQSTSIPSSSGTNCVASQELKSSNETGNEIVRMHLMVLFCLFVCL